MLKFPRSQGFGCVSKKPDADGWQGVEEKKTPPLSGWAGLLTAVNN